MYWVPFDDVALSATADVWKSIAGIVAGATAGLRARVTRIVIGPSDDAPFDRDLVFRIGRMAAGLGTATAIAANAIPKKDPAGRDALCSGNVNYTVEPTNMEANPMYLPMNDRGGIDHPLVEDREKLALIGAANSTIVLQGTARTSNATQSRVSGYIGFEEY
jgi:hypothetical protein